MERSREREIFILSHMWYVLMLNKVYVTNLIKIKNIMMKLNCNADKKFKRADTLKRHKATHSTNQFVP